LPALPRAVSVVAGTPYAPSAAAADRRGEVHHLESRPEPRYEAGLPAPPGHRSGPVDAGSPAADARRRSPWLEEEAEVLSQEQRGPDWFALALRAPTIAARALPGQFVQLRIGQGVDPLLRRPFSFCTLQPEDGTFTLIYRVVGAGTRLLSLVRPGERLSLLGPLGLSFPSPDAGDPGRRLMLVGGGLGIPPLACAAAWARRAGRGTLALLGARTAAYLAGAAEVKATGAEVVAVTEDGTAGRAGLVTDVLGEILTATDDVWACGPNAMLAAVRTLCRQRGARGWLCVEQPMACGFGVCIGCAVPKADGSGYLKACVDGPVFPAEAVELPVPTEG
jgi:dihydroorotate dehydrogenase electron transfer subunit